MGSSFYFLLVAAVGLIGGLVFLLIKQRAAKDGPPPSSRPSDALVPSRRGKEPESVEVPGLEPLVKGKRFAEAAQLALKHEAWAKATSLYVRASQFDKAAHCARRGGRHREAAELYERAGDLGNAAISWGQSGDPERALAARHALENGESGKGQGEAPLIPPEELAKLQAQLEMALAKPDHPAAAGVYDAMGRLDEAASQWVREARKTRNADEYIERIAVLSNTVAHNFLRMEAKGRPASEKSAKVHYHLAKTYVVLDQPAEALRIIKALLRAVPDHPEGRALCDELGGEGAKESLVPASSVDPASVESLLQLVAGKACDLGNIEVYYRLGLACEAAGKPDDARRAYAAVEEASPGYRDAGTRQAALEKQR